MYRYQASPEKGYNEGPRNTNLSENLPSHHQNSLCWPRASRDPTPKVYNDAYTQEPSIPMVAKIETHHPFIRFCVAKRVRTESQLTQPLRTQGPESCHTLVGPSVPSSECLPFRRRTSAIHCQRTSAGSKVPWEPTEDAIKVNDRPNSNHIYAHLPREAPTILVAQIIG